MNDIPELQAMYKVVDRWRHLDARRLDDGTELIGRVPHVAPEAWLHVLYAGLTTGDIDDLEKEIGRKITASLARFLKRHNGLNLFSGALSIDGLRSGNKRTPAVRQPFSMRVPNTHERPKDAKESALFIGGYSTDGSLLYIDVADGRAHRCARESAEPLNSWNDLFDMLVRESVRISGLFDNQGRKLRENMPTTPPAQQRVEDP